MVPLSTFVPRRSLLDTCISKPFKLPYVDGACFILVLEIMEARTDVFATALSDVCTVRFVSMMTSSIKSLQTSYKKRFATERCIQ